MKKRLSALLLLFAAGTLAAASFDLPGGILSLPSAGIINPAEGTVEITVTPAGDVKDLRNDWSNAFVLPGKENSNAERTVLGIYTPTGNPETEHGLRGIIDKVSFRQNVYVIILAAQTIAPGSSIKNPNVLAEQRVAVTVIRDAYSGNWTISDWRKLH